MSQIFRVRISTMMQAFVSAYLRSSPLVGSSECPSCGRKYSVRAVDGTCVFSCENGSHSPNSSAFRLAVAVTDDESYSISCECGASESIASGRDFGDDEPISSMPANYRDIQPRDNPTIPCSKCAVRFASFKHVTADSLNVRPRWPYLCRQCLRLVIAADRALSR